MLPKGGMLFAFLTRKTTRFCIVITTRPKYRPLVTKAIEKLILKEYNAVKEKKNAKLFDINGNQKLPNKIRRYL